MILDALMALNALIWFAALLVPAFGFVNGFRGRRGALIRAQGIVLALLVVHLGAVILFGTDVAADQQADLEMLRRYRVELVLGVAVSLAAGWLTFWLGGKMAGRKG